MADLRTDYEDDVLDTSVNEKRKYRMITNDDDTVSFEDVTEYAQVGDSFGSDILNQIVAKITIDVIDALADVLTNTENGVLVGANAVKELKNTLQSAIDAKVTNSFTGERALIAGTNGMVTTSGTTSTELYMLHGIKSNVQTQLDGKVPSGGSARVASVSFNDSAAIYSTDENLNFQYKDSAGNLQGMNMDYIATRLANALLKWGGTMTGRLETDKSLGMGLGSGSYAIAPIVINADTVNNQAIRSGIGFHNQGRNGTCLYLDLDGALKHVDSAGVSRVLMDSRNFQYDASTQTLNITL